MFFPKNECTPVKNVLAGDTEAAALLDALEAKGVALIQGSFRLEDGSAFIEHRSVWRAEGERASEALEREISGTVHDFKDVIERGLVMSLAEVWEDGCKVVANLWIDVKERRIVLTEVRQLVYEHESDFPSVRSLVL